MTRRFPNSVVFLENYNMDVACLLVSGCDLWLNSPRRHLEACGTSGMKAALNGVLNLSTLNGWWPEFYRAGENGWEFGDGYEGEDQDEHDAAALVRVLKEQVLPTYYDARPKWEQMMNNSVTQALQQCSAARMIRECYKWMYSVCSPKRLGKAV